MLNDAVHSARLPRRTLSHLSVLAGPTLTAAADRWHCHSTWNRFGCSGISGQVLMDTADSFVKLGLDTLGYEFVNRCACDSLGCQPQKATGHCG